VRHDVFALRALHHANGAVRLVILNLAQSANFFDHCVHPVWIVSPSSVITRASERT
jgi:hypothetical protein